MVRSQHCEWPVPTVDEKGEQHNFALQEMTEASKNLDLPLYPEVFSPVPPGRGGGSLRVTEDRRRTKDGRKSLCPILDLLPFSPIQRSFVSCGSQFT